MTCCMCSDHPGSKGLCRAGLKSPSLEGPTRSIQVLELHRLFCAQYTWWYHTHTPPPAAGWREDAGESIPQCRCGRGTFGPAVLCQDTGCEIALPYPCCILQTAHPFFHCPWDGTGWKAGGKCKMGADVCTGVSFGVGQGALNTVGSMAHGLFSLWEHNQLSQIIPIKNPTKQKRRERCLFHSCSSV